MISCAQSGMILGYADPVPISIYRSLLAHDGDPRWWPARTPYEVMVGAVLTQNTLWDNVEKAIAGFGDGPTPCAVSDMPLGKLRDMIRPAGSFVRKADTLKAVTAWYARYDWDMETVKRQPLHTLRAELLSLHGVGPETADAMLLYAFGFPTFVVDAYTVRLCRRYPLPAGTSYAQVKAFFEENLPRETALYNRMHALIVRNAKAHCRTKPVCAGCPISIGCRKLAG